MCRASGYLLLGTQSHRFFTPLFCQVQRARNSLQNAVTGNGEVVFIGTYNLRFQFIQPIGCIVQFLSHLSIYFLLSLPLLGK